MRKNCYSYPVEFVDDAFGDSPTLADTLAKVTGPASKMLIVADVNVVQQTQGLGKRIGAYVREHEIALAGSPLVMPGGERIKADELRSVMSVATAILDSRIGQSDVVLAIGGGTLLDVVGYAAAQVRGGMKLVRMPTTPAAMVGGAYASSAAVNIGSVKDALKVKSEPVAAIIDTSFAKSVLDGVWRGGLSEAIRIALTCDSVTMKKIIALAPAYRSRDPDALKELAKIVNGTVAKNGISQFAEWSAIRLESMSGYKLPHGYAVSIGIWIEMLYALKTGNISQKDYDALISMMREGGLADGITNSRYLLRQGDQLLYGIEALKLATGRAAITIPVGIGKGKEIEEPDRGVYQKVFEELANFPI